MKLFGILLALLARVLVPRPLGVLESAVSRIYKLRPRPNPQPSLVAALIAGEDHRFYRHRGVDPIAMMRVAYRFVTRGQLSGASTIEQQLVRVLTGDRERNLKRKVREMLLASHISKNYQKSDIAEMYLSVAYFGWRMNGVEEACNRLCIDPTRATARQAASLIARLKYPQPYELTTNLHLRITQRTEHILRRLSETGKSLQGEVSSNAAISDIRQM
jgi:membrane peptidoglycan carboxypeptidase